MKKQDAGRKILGNLAPQFAELNDDVLFGEVWNRESELSLRDRSLITIAALFSAGQFPQLKAHLEIGKAHGITKNEVIEVFTQLAFYCGWPKAWSSFPLIEEVYGKDTTLDLSIFPVGEKNPYGQYFIGQSYLYPLNTEGLPLFNVTFEPGCRNNWHFITLVKVEDNSLSAFMEPVGIKKKERKPELFIQEILSIFPLM